MMPQAGVYRTRSPQPSACLPTRPGRCSSRRRHVVSHIQIDRRHHMEIAWKRQQAVEAQISAELEGPQDGVVWEVRNLAHLEKIHTVAEDRLIVMLAYNRSCGSCKRAQEYLEQMCRQNAFAKAGITHCKHDTVNEFDYASDVSRMYNVRHVPSFLLFYQGALIDRQRLPESRAGAYGPSKQINQMLQMAMAQVDKRVRKQVLRFAPSASMPSSDAPANQDVV